MGEIDGVGEMVTGGLIAAAVEPAAGGLDAGRSGNCLNCAAPLSGPYCWACGQKGRVHRSLATFFHDMIAGLFNFEGKIWRTLPMLAWRPGDMTRRYIDGQRARFVSPVALYLFTVFLMFAVLNFTGISTDPGSIQTNLGQAAAKERTQLKKFEEARAAALAKGVDVAAIDRRIAASKEDVVQLERMQGGELVQINELDEEDAPLWLREAVARIQRDPAGFIRKVQDAASKFSWLLIPLSVPFLWLLFPFSRRYHLYDHTVFVTYSLSFMMMLVIAGGLLVSLGAPSLASMLFFLPPVHMYRQLRGAYSLSRLNALLRTIVLMIFSFAVSLLFFLAMVGIGLFD